MISDTLIVTLPNLPEISLLSTIIRLVQLLFVYLVGKTIYNLYFHPLAAYPGPLLWRASRIPYNWHTLRGTSAHSFRRLHHKYGDVVRYSPNAVSYTHPGAWEEIYCHRKMEMDPAIFGGGITVSGATQITNAIHEEHHRIRRRFMTAMSGKAIASQEPILQQYAKALVDGIKKELERNSGVVDMATWLSMATFDVISDLAFSRSFSGLATGIAHPWMLVVFGAFKALPILRVIREVPGVKLIGHFAKHLLPTSIKKRWLDHFKYGADLIDERLASGIDRPDFIRHLIAPGNHPLTKDEIKENAVQMVTAGAEPTASFVTGMCYFLVKNLTVYEKLKSELALHVKTHEDLSLVNLAKLDYLGRVIREGLRMFPPAADIFPRIIPPDGMTIMGDHLQEGTHVGICSFAASYMEWNFPDPYTFDPERWSETNASDERLKASQPFGLGHRSCIGKGIAWAEVRLLLTSIMLNFEMEICAEDETWFEDLRVFIGWEKTPLRFRLTPTAWSKENQ